MTFNMMIAIACLAVQALSQPKKQPQVGQGRVTEFDWIDPLILEADPDQDGMVERADYKLLIYKVMLKPIQDDGEWTQEVDLDLRELAQELAADYKQDQISVENLFQDIVVNSEKKVHLLKLDGLAGLIFKGE